MPSMGSVSDLTLQYRRPSGQISSSMLKASGSCPVGVEMDDQMQKIQEHLKALEEERLKIEAFKRELPFCMELLNDAIEASQEELATYESYPETTKCGRKEGESGLTSNQKPVLEEFIPVNKTYTEESEEIEMKSKAKGDKIDWMSSAQLWNQNCDTKENTVRQPQKSLVPLNSKQRVGGAFHPFSQEREEIAPSRCSAQRGLPDLGLSSGGPEEADHHGGLNNNNKIRCNEAGDQIEGCIVPGNRNTFSTNSHTPQQPGQTQRKARRCWSPELHRKFVNALQHLGGSQVATPKQIRELMKVDGLTNDEVKSHLQEKSS